jgi:hypothetical protein
VVRNVPGVLNWNRNKAPVFKDPDANAFVSETTVCGTSACWFVHTTVVPLATVIVTRLKVKSLMVTVTVAKDGNSSVGVGVTIGV